MGLFADAGKIDLATERLLISPLALHDAPFILELLNTEKWIRFIGDKNVRSTADAENFIDKILQGAHADYWVARLKEGGRPIGIVTFVKRMDLEHPDIGFACLPRFFNKGYALEATRSVLENAVDLFGLEKISAITLPENSSSVRLLGKLNFHFQKKIIMDKGSMQLFSIDADTVRIDRAVRTFFGVFNNGGGRRPRVDLLKGLCIPEVLIVRKTDTVQETYTLRRFMATRKKILENGTYMDFEEHETFSDTKTLGTIAQRISRYEKSGKHLGRTFRVKGSKLFQLLKTGNGWKIASVIWEDDKVATGST